LLSLDKTSFVTLFCTQTKSKLGLVGCFSFALCPERVWPSEKEQINQKELMI